jgi:hypothetical protein
VKVGIRSMSDELAVRTWVVSLVGLCLSGCLDFGEDTQLVTPQVTSNELAEVTRRTGIQFPTGTIGLGYLYLGSGIDDALAIKISIPAARKVEFLGNDLFQDECVWRQVGKGQSWWSPGDLTERKDYNKDLPQGRYVECSLGKEDGQWIANISWIST